MNRGHSPPQAELSGEPQIRWRIECRGDNHDIATIGFAADYILVQRPQLTDIARRRRPIEQTASHGATIVIRRHVNTSAAASFDNR
jgi:hypothetical protein